MKKYSLTLLSSACLLVLSACSSSSGGGGGANPTYLTELPPQPSVQTPTETAVTSAPTTTASAPTTTNRPATNTHEKPTVTNVKFGTDLFKTAQNARLTGAIVTISPKAGANGRDLTHVEKEGLDTLLIDGTEIALRTLAEEEKQAGFNPINAADQRGSKLGEISGLVNKSSIYGLYNQTVYQYVRFGVVNAGNQSHLFVQGLQTPTTGVWDETENGHANLYPMPKNGKFIYHKGDALYGKAGEYQALNAVVKADFSTKRLDVALKDGSTEKLAFNAEINGNTFSGSNNQVESRGAFYGSQANQVGGVFYDNQSGNHGVFGATDKRPQ